jgi:hypothetical protein
VHQQVAIKTVETSGTTRNAVPKPSPEDEGRSTEMEKLTDGGDCSDNLSQLQLVKDRRFTSGIETDHEDAHLLLGKQAGKKLGESEPHLGTPFTILFCMWAPKSELQKRPHNSTKKTQTTNQAKKQQI